MNTTSQLRIRHQRADRSVATRRGPRDNRALARLVFPALTSVGLSTATTRRPAMKAPEHNTAAPHSLRYGLLVLAVATCVGCSSGATSLHTPAVPCASLPGCTPPPSTSSTVGLPTPALPCASLQGCTTSTQQTPGVRTVPGLAITSLDGYKYEVRLVSPAEAISTAIVAGRINGPSTVDAPPGSQFIAVTLDVTNPTNQQEPLESLATTDYQRAFVHLALPMADASQISGLDPTYDCNTSDPQIPASYCALDTFRGSVNPASDLIATEMAPGSTSRVRFIAGVDHAGGATEGYKTPLPLKDAATFIRGTDEQQLR